MASIPRDPSLEASFALKRDPYGFISERARMLGSDVFETRLLLRRTICMTGPQAARLFYDPRCFARHGAAPAALRKTLLGQGGVQTLDGDAHLHRKRLFLELLAPARVAALVRRAAHEWERAAQRWKALPRVELYAELQPLLARAVCTWAGVPLAESEVAARTRELTALFDAAGSAGWSHLQARRARARSERWAADIVERLRETRFHAAEDTAVHRIAFHRELDGALLPPRIAAVELLNVLRPTVATSVYVVFAAHALHAHPDWRAKLAAGDPAHADAFVQEIRRAYPFFPAVPARVREDFVWRDLEFRAGTRALLDLYGTNHDPRAWEEPEAFRPERFLGELPSPFAFVPQGGADPQLHHRCPGEGVVLELMKQALRFLTGSLDYTVPPQDLAIDRTRLPALPHSRFVITDVRPR
ncbi:MAG: cytochrome P450 [Proteobacteria bacterium]|nr:MAG: cytochrome P450 [Pseudomonadota bacterium]